MSNTTEPDDVFDGDPFDPEVARATENKQYESAKAANDGSDVILYLRARAQAYKQVFGNVSDPAVRIVLQDLGLFCRAAESRYHAEDKKQNMLEGRAEVFYRIQQHTRLDAEQLFMLLTDAKLKQQ